MTTFDFNQAEPQQARGSLIPDNTVATVIATLRPGGAGFDGWLKNNRDGSCQMADFEFTVEGGDFDRRKFWTMFVVEGDTDGEKKAAAISRSKLRAMLESAYGIDPNDDSDAAMEKRRVTGWANFDGLRFCAKIGIEKGALKDKTAGPDSERYEDKNVLKAVITPDETTYLHPGAQTAGAKSVGAAVNSAAKAAGGGTAAAVAAAGKPSWAQ